MHALPLQFDDAVDRTATLIAEETRAGAFLTIAADSGASAGVYVCPDDAAVLGAALLEYAARAG